MKNNMEHPKINSDRFEYLYKAFKEFIEKESERKVFDSFESNRFLNGETGENYKYEVAKEARKQLASDSWDKTDIGNGRIIESVIKSIEIKNNNFFEWKGGRFPQVHKYLYDVQDTPDEQKLLEDYLFQLYHKSKDAETFDNLVKILGRKYPLIAYLFFIKDESKYVPIAPKFFDEAFNLLAANFKTNQRCSWQNYSTYIGLMYDLKNRLADLLPTEVNLLDAHSFVWVLVGHMKMGNEEHTKMRDEEKVRLERLERLERLKKANPIPTTKIVEVTIFNRDQDVVDEVLYRANGVCEDCKQPAPFLRASDETPYLEVHHVIRLADGGEDTVENAIALCPNCHRQRHYG